MYFTNFAKVAWPTIINLGHAQFIRNQVRTDKVTPVKLFGKSESDKILHATTHLTDSVNKTERLCRLTCAVTKLTRNILKTAEVITHPSAKYDADGVDGVINIQTKIIEP